MTNPQAAEPTQSPETVGEMAESAKNTPGPISQDQLREDRLICQRSLAAIAAEIMKAEGEIAKIEARLDGVGLAVPQRERFHTHRRLLREKVEDWKDDLESGQRRLAQIDQLLEADAGEKALTTRKTAQAAATEVAGKIRGLVGQLAELWHRFRVLEEEDRVAADIVRSVSPGRFGEITTFSWSTGTDQNFASVIEGVIGECRRAEKDLQKREAARK